MKVLQSAKVLSIVTTVLTFSAVLSHTTAALAKPTGVQHTYVSSTGSDTSLCTRVAPCRYFAAAYSKTEKGGEIDALDSADFGPLDITGSITVVGLGVNATLSQGSANSIIVVEAGLGDVVNLENLNFIGGGNEYGIVYTSGSQLNIDNCLFTNVGFPLTVAPSGSTAQQNFVISNSTLNGINDSLGAGVVVQGGATVTGTLRNVTIKGFSAGVSVTNGNVSISNSDISYNSAVGLVVSGGSLTASHVVLNGNAIAVHSVAPGIMNVDSSTISGNGVALSADSGSNLRIHDNSIYDNQTAITCGSGPYAVVNSTGDNRKGQNKFGTAPNCPSSAITAVTLQ